MFRRLEAGCLSHAVSGIELGWFKQTVIQGRTHVCLRRVQFLGRHFGCLPAETRQRHAKTAQGAAPRGFAVAGASEGPPAQRGGKELTTNHSAGEAVRGSVKYFVSKLVQMVGSFCTTKKKDDRFDQTAEAPNKLITPAVVL